MTSPTASSDSASHAGTAAPGGATDATDDSDIAGMTFEDALAELDRIVRRLEEGQGALDDAIRSYERGAKLKQHCEAKLREAQAKVESISLSADGSVSTQPLDGPEKDTAGKGGRG